VERPGQAASRVRAGISMRIASGPISIRRRCGVEAKVCIVTGATSGLGLATATALARRGQNVVMLCRDRSRGEAARARVTSLSGGQSVQLAYADLSSQASTREFAAEFERTHGGLDVLINNAAVFTRTRTVTPDGLETMFATNHLGPFQLTNLLVGLLKSGAPSRVINVTAPSTSKLDLDDLQCEREFRALTAFRRSKMCNLLFTYELARRLQGTGVTVNAFHPGLVRSKLMSEAPALLRLPMRLVPSRRRKRRRSCCISPSPRTWKTSAAGSSRKRRRSGRAPRGLPD
jgi:NAD(P)-dependent dehydrogenase (short-subunit alcohol dehydrogenase family)